MNIIQNIQSIIALAVVVILNIAAIAKGVTAIVKRVQEVKDATAEEKQEAKATVIENLQQVIFGWVTDAEKDLGGGTGKLKSAKVAALIYESIPDDLKPLFTPQEIQDMIDTVLEDAKKYWGQNSKAREYIESGAAAVFTATAEIGAVNVADGFPAEEIARAVGAGVSAAIKNAVETAQTAPASGETQEPADGENTAAEAPQEPPAAVPDSPGETAEN